MRNIVVLALAVSSVAFSQAPAERVSGLPQFLEVLLPRELGPSVMGGRISSLAVYEKEPRIFYVGSASGGVWKTENAGITFRPVFYQEDTVATGAVAVDQNDPDHVWVGTGEQNSRGSSSWGGGVYVSKDGGETWTDKGLKETKHISRVIIHPTDPDTVFVAALGHLWGENEERGIYKTTDGGDTWVKVLYEDARSGFIALEMDPSDPDKMLAASWERMRWAYKWASGGPATTLYRTTDGGETWSKSMDGIPESDTGRIGLSYHRANPELVVATIEKAVVRDGGERTTDGGVYKSTNGGRSWKKVNDLNPRPFYFSLPVYDPVDENRIYLFATQAYVSEDGGETFNTMRMSVHVDYHAAWVNPNNNNHLLVGNDGGVGQSRDQTKTWEHLNYMRLGQFYAIGVDMRKPYWVYGGLQDNGSWAGPTQTGHGGVNFNDWYGVGGGDGFYVQVDPEDWKTLYSESQGGRISRINQATGARRSVSPRATEGEPRLRFNWSTPIHISPHNSRTLYVGSQYLHKSIDRGDSWQTISPDLTTNDESKQNPRAGVTPENTGAERHTTITSISESEIVSGLIWVGTDDGNVQVTRDGGQSWTNVIGNFEGVPEFTWVSRVRASRFVEGRAYVTFDGHRNNDYAPYVFVTEDFGETWADMSSNIPDGDSVYVVHEGMQNESLLIVGTEFGLYVSNDRGILWTRYRTGEWPTVRVDDVVIHPRELDLVIGTHGRSIWTVPLAPLEQLTNENLEADAFVCKPQNMYLLGYTTRLNWAGNRLWQSPNSQPNAFIYYHLKDATEEDVRIVIRRPNGEEVADIDGDGDAGLNMVRWRPNRRRPATPGEYSVTLYVGDASYTTSITVEDLSRSNDPNVMVPRE